MQRQSAVYVLAVAAALGALAAVSIGPHGSPRTDPTTTSGQPPEAVEHTPPGTADTLAPDEEALPPRSREGFRPPTGELFAYTVEPRERADGEPYTLHRWRMRLEDLEIRVEDQHMGVDLAEHVRAGADLVINGGFYGTDAAAEGLVISHGEVINPYLRRIGGGVVVIAGDRGLQLDAEAEDVESQIPADTRFAMQCRPRLVVDGAVNIRRFVNNTAARTALCVREDATVLDVYIARVEPSRGRAGPSLWTFAHDLADAGCEEALNLDGGPSTGVAWRSEPGRVRHLPPRRGVRHAVLFLRRGQPR